MVEPQLLLVGRRVGGAGYDPKSFGFRWFLPSLWRYRRPLMHVLLASLFVQVFGAGDAAVLPRWWSTRCSATRAIPP